jgi:hypothetical protein
MNDDRHLPVINDYQQTEDLPACSPKIYVSNEEAALLASMRRLRDSSLEIRRSLESAAAEDRPRLQAELARMREEWTTLAERREEAWRNKMIALGHIPPPQY